MDINLLRERKTPSEMTVTELNNYIKNLIEGDRWLKALSVKGEISNFTYHRSGHLYFSLKDEGGQIKAVMFRSAAQNLRFMPENGMKVVLRCSVGVYQQSGEYRLYVTSMQPDGVGALYLAYEQLKIKLEAEGLFANEHKQSIPEIPTKIGVITSPTGAAIRDIINILNRRFSLAKVYLYPALVQGEYAEASLIEGLEYFDKSGLADVIIIGRGGGSIEDLWAFNGEALARKIFTCEVPIISAVGHETDFTICDFVADLRAPTPSAAAELAVPDCKELLMRLDAIAERCLEILVRKLEKLEMRYNDAVESKVIAEPNLLFEEKSDDLSRLNETLFERIEKVVENRDNKFKYFVGKLDSLSPLAVLSRGYSVISKNGDLVRSVGDLNIDDVVNIRLSDGEAFAKMIEKE